MGKAATRNKERDAQQITKVAITQPARCGGKRRSGKERKKKMA